MSEKLYPIKLYVQHLPHAFMIMASLLINAGMWVQLLWQLHGSGAEQIFLHYNMLFGVDAIGDWWKVLYLPMAGLFVLLLNIAIGWVLYQKDKFSGYVLSAATLLFQIFLFIASTLLVFLNV